MKWYEETAWAVIVAGLTYIVGVAAAGMPTDHWQVWAMTLAAGVGRVAVATVISRFGAKPPAAEYNTQFNNFPATPLASTITVASTTTNLGSPATNIRITPVNPIDPVVPDTQPPATLPDHTGTLPRPTATSASPTS